MKLVNFPESSVLSLLLGSIVFSSPLYAEQIGPSSATVSTVMQTWQENGIWNLSFESAKKQLKAKMVAQGYTEKHEIKSNGKKDRSLFLWQKNSRKIIYMIWKIDIDKTGFSWGWVHEKTDK